MTAQISNELVAQLLEQNNKLMQLLQQKEAKKQSKKIIAKTYLNKHCENSININEFLERFSKSLTNDDLLLYSFKDGDDTTATLIKNYMKRTNDKAFYCADVNRGVIYVKDENNKWVKDVDYSIMTQFLKRVSYIMVNKLGDWRTANPECRKASSALSDKYNMMVINICGLNENIHKTIRLLINDIKLQPSSADSESDNESYNNSSDSDDNEM
jgi:hypothetical protein